MRCLRCGGLLLYEHTEDGPEVSCINCGDRRSAVALVPLSIPEARTTWHKPLKAKL